MLMLILTFIGITVIIAATLIIATYIDERNTPHF
jgi:hypothetical protein